MASGLRPINAVFLGPMLERMCVTLGPLRPRMAVLKASRAITTVSKDPALGLPSVTCKRCTMRFGRSVEGKIKARTCFLRTQDRIRLQPSRHRGGARRANSRSTERSAVQPLRIFAICGSLERPFQRPLVTKLSYGCVGSPSRFITGATGAIELERILMSGSKPSGTEIADKLLPK
jgi:hypothetical protein